MATWQCIQGCGACCHLDPKYRDLETYLTPELMAQYLSMVGADGWCLNYDKTSRECRIYRDRPIFCRVTPDNFQRMYDTPPEEFHEFAIDCCLQQIEGVYGEESGELDRYYDVVLPDAIDLDL